MKNLLTGMAACLMLSFSLKAQDYTHANRLFKKGQTDIQIGYSLLSSAKILDKATSKLPRVTIRGDRFFGNNFSFGVGYSLASHESQPFLIADGFRQRITNTIHQMVVRPTFHITSLKNADFYGGVLIGLSFEIFRVDQGEISHIQTHKNFQPQRTKGIYSAFVGARYGLSKKWSVFSELGFSASLLSLGFGYRI